MFIHAGDTTLGTAHHCSLNQDISTSLTEINITVLYGSQRLCHIMVWCQARKDILFPMMYPIYSRTSSMLFYQKEEISHSNDMAQLVGAKVKATDFNIYDRGYCKKNTKDMQMHAVLPMEIMPTASIIVHLSLLPEMWAGYQKATEDELY